ncbi:MAG: ABC transporter permease, partial [Bacilli bacterium]|nr:ABC transporter permease [Bacilli bacterium]
MNLLNKLTIKNLKLNKKRTVVTIIGIMLSVALLTAVSSMYYSFVSSLVSYEKKENGNFHVVLYNVPTSEEKQFEYNKSVESVSITESLGYSPIEVKTQGYKPYAHVIKFSKEALDNISPTLISGRLPENSNEVVIPNHLKTNGRLDLKEGDTITLNLGTRVDEEGNEIFLDAYKKVDEEVNETLINQKEKTFTVVGIVSSPSHYIEFSGDPGYSFITYGDIFDNLVNVYIKFKKESLKDIYINTGRFINIDPELFNKFYHDEPLTEKEDAIFEQQYENRTYRYDFNKHLISLETDPLKSTGLDSVGIVVIIVLAIIIFTSVFCIKNSFDISITEKIKQYGMLRSIGATKKQIKKN